MVLHFATVNPNLISSFRDRDCDLSLFQVQRVKVKAFKFVCLALACLIILFDLVSFNLQHVSKLFDWCQVQV